MLKMPVEEKPAEEKKKEIGLESKYQTRCKDLAKISYKCSEKYGIAGCTEHFDAYRKCIKEEHTQKIEARRRRFSGES